MSSEIEAILGKRREKISRGVFELLEDYIFGYTNPEKLNLLTLEEAEKGLHSSEKKVFRTILKFSRKGLLISRKKIQYEVHYERGFIPPIMKKLSQKRIVGEYSISEYACVFLQCRGVHLKFPPPLDESLDEYKGYFKARRMREIFKKPGKYLPRLSYARVQIEGIPVHRRVFPRPGEIILFNAFDLFTK